jgi:DNA-binding transcriptional LysR family regulator
LLRELRDRNIDVAIGTSIAPISDENMESKLLFRDRLVIVAGASSKWAGRRKIKPDELLGEPWTFPPAGSIPSTNIANAFKSAGLACPRPTVPTDSISAIIHLLAAGRFLTVLPESMIRFRAKNLPLKVLPVELPARQLSVVIVTMKNRTLSPLAKLFIDSARAMSRPLA